MMNAVRNTLLILLGMMASQLVTGQSLQTVYQLSGLIINKSSNEPAPYARVRINNSRRGGFANLEGFYSIPVFPTDTVYFSSIGYKTTKFIIADYLKEYKGNSNSQYLYAINYIEEDSIVLPDMVIFPYNTSMELRTALIETNVPEAIESVNARNNLNPDVMDVLMEGMAVDEGERVMVARQMYYREQQQQHVAPTMTLFDPVAIYQLLNYIHTKSKERKEKDLDYWSE